MFDRKSSLASFTIPGLTQTAATIITRVIPPFAHPTAGPLLQSNASPKKFGAGRTIVKKVCYTTLGTAHAIIIARPFNYTTITTAAAKNTSTIVLADDPGAYSTNYKYPNAAGGVPASVADNAIATNDFVCFQLADGTWHFSKVTVTGLSMALTTAMPNPTGAGGVLAGALCYFYGNITSDLDPATGFANPTTTIALSTTRDATWADSDVGVVDALHAGDPLVFHSANATNAGTLEWISGVYESINS